MVDLDLIKRKINGHKHPESGWMFNRPVGVAYDFITICDELVKEIERLNILLSENWNEHEFSIADDYEVLALADQNIDYHGYYNKYIPKVSPLVQSVVKKLFKI